MTPNPILDEIHAARAALLAAHENDLHNYVEAARKRALASGRKLVTPEIAVPAQALKPGAAAGEPEADASGSL
jgi:hypothetical protein